MRLIDADELTRRIEQSYLTEGEKRLFSVKVRHMPTIVNTERPVVILYGQAIYITQGHIDAMIEYERKQKEQEFIDNFMKGLNDERT